MRVQLQQQRGGRTLHNASHVLRRIGGVGSQELIFALRRLRHDPALPKGEQMGADAALARAIAWIEQRPPDGVHGRFSNSFYFDPQQPEKSWRFDVEGLSGYNLLR
jgi:hypothetical protein